MRQTKSRLTVTVDASLLRAARDAVRRGSAASLSGWVNGALADRAERERRLRALSEALALYEAEHGAISADEIAAQLRSDRAAAVVVRGARGESRRRRA